MYRSWLKNTVDLLSKLVREGFMYVVFIHPFDNASFNNDATRPWYSSTLSYTSRTRSHFSRLSSPSSVTLSTSRISRTLGHLYHSLPQPFLLPVYWSLQITSHGFSISRIPHIKQDILEVILGMGPRHQDSLKLLHSSAFVFGWHPCFFSSAWVQMTTHYQCRQVRIFFRTVSH